MIVRSAVLKKCIKDRDKRLLAVCLILAALMVVMVVSMFAIAIYLDLHPRLPILTMTNTTIGRFSLEQQGSSDEITVEAFMAFTMESRNRYGIPFRFVNDTLSLEYKGHSLASVVSPAFPQEPRSNVSFPLLVNDQSTLVQGSDVVRDLQYDFQVNRVVVSLAGTIKARFTASKAVTSSAVGVPVSCELVIQPVSVTAKFKCQEFIS